MKQGPAPLRKPELPSMWDYRRREWKNPLAPADLPRDHDTLLRCGIKFVLMSLSCFTDRFAVT